MGAVIAEMGMECNEAGTNLCNLQKEKFPLCFVVFMLSLNDVAENETNQPWL